MSDYSAGKLNVVDVVSNWILCSNPTRLLTGNAAGGRGVMFACPAIRALRNGKLSSDEAYNTIAKIFGDENQDLVDEFELHMSRNKIKKRKNKEEENNLSASAKIREFKAESTC
ncbi:hypothetical protein HAX54_045866 [Datura stramonium]|uniref:Uncharacterized protein n=1 Tax=Datura stramonium TaxID=4076 RepID=A0ABS8SR49_DATST|nr:hypothetical protein [Datura stramonium]